MNWFLRPITGRAVSINITQAQFHELASARDVLSAAIAQEERFTILLENGFDFAMEVLGAGLRQAVRSTRHPHELHAERVQFNRRLLNLTAAAKSFTEQISVHIDALAGDEKATVLDEISHQYSTSKGYRVMEAVRNVAHHLEQATHNMAFHHDIAGGRPRVAVKPFLVARKLAEAGLHPKGAKVIEELQQGGDLHLVTPIVYDYLDGLDQIHRKVRKVVAPRAQKACTCFAEALQQAAQTCGPVIGLMAGGVEAGKALEEFQVFDGLPTYWRHLSGRPDTLRGLTCSISDGVPSRKTTVNTL